MVNLCIQIYSCSDIDELVCFVYYFCLCRDVMGTNLSVKSQRQTWRFSAIVAIGQNHQVCPVGRLRFSLKQCAQWCVLASDDSFYCIFDDTTDTFDARFVYTQFSLKHHQKAT